MPTFTDSFPAAALDATKWASATSGSVSLVIGSPSDGVYPQTVNDEGDAVTVSSSGLLTVPGSSGFDIEIYYEDIFTDVDETIITFLGWRSDQLDTEGNPAYGIDIALSVRPGPLYEFEQGAINLGTFGRSVLATDTSSGGDGGFRIARSGNNYTLYSRDATNTAWSSLATVVLPHVGPGYIVFGQFAESPTYPFPWISQT